MTSTKHKLYRVVEETLIDNDAYAPIRPLGLGYFHTMQDAIEQLHRVHAGFIKLHNVTKRDEEEITTGYPTAIQNNMFTAWMWDDHPDGYYHKVSIKEIANNNV